MATSVAPTTPADAAKMVETTMTARPRPPRIGPNTTYMDVKSDSAIPEAFISCAMKMKSGTATRT